MTKLTNPYPIFYDADGIPLDGGYIYVGTPSADPQTSPINLFWDFAQTIAAPQPLRTIGGQIVNGANPSPIFFAETDFSMRVTDSNGAQVFYSASIYTNLSALQPLNATLTAISAQGGTAYGISLLNLANAAALKAATGIPDCLALVGGTITGNITRQGAGVHIYHNDPALTSGRVFVTAAGAADPTSLPGDIWLRATT